MGAGEEGGAHESGGRAEDGSGEGVDAVAAHVAVAVPGGGGEEGFGDLRLAEAVEDVFGILAGDAVDVGEEGGEGRLRARGLFAHKRRDLHSENSFSQQFGFGREWGAPG